MKNCLIALLLFGLSAIITWYFIQTGKALYISQRQMILSCGIAAAKWAIQLIAALLFLENKKWVFIQQIAFTCFLGSLILLPYCLFDGIRQTTNSFLASLIIAVLLMIISYYRAVRKTRLSIKWFLGWIICLAIAILLQLFWVFSSR